MKKLLVTLTILLATISFTLLPTTGARPRVAHAASITVNITGDIISNDSNCSLREAIYAAQVAIPYNGCNAGDIGADTINFSVSGTIALVAPLDTIVTEITVDGAGQTIAISGNNLFRGFRVGSTGNLTLNQITIQNGRATEGGGIYSEGTLAVTNSTFSGNRADEWGGGIWNDGALTVTDSTFSGNVADRFGGGIWNDGALTVTDSTFSGNRADEWGGGIFNHGTLTVTNSTFSSNSVTRGIDFHTGGGGIGNEGTLTVTNSTFSGNTSSSSGGGIFNLRTLTVTNSTFASNTTTVFGGGIFNHGILTVTNSTFSNNTTTGYGSGIYSRNGTLIVTNSTFSGNTSSSPGGGTVRHYDGDTHLAGTIFATNTNNCVFDGGTLNDNGYNLSDDTTCVSGGPGSLTNATLNLLPLANNGGPTQTHLPDVGSDAIGAIPQGTTITNNTVSWTCNDADTFTDQRGIDRPIYSGDNCTSGAVEVATPGTIIVEKQTLPDGSAQSFEFNPSYESNFTLTDNGTNNSGLLTPGIYSVSEINIPPNWNLTSATCSDGSAPSAISLDPGETVTCTFTNEADGVIIVEKQTVPDGSPQIFEFSTSYSSSFILTDGGTNNSGSLTPGTYAVGENVLANWSLTSATCSDGSDPSAIGLDPGETVTCVFTNEANPGVIIVEKQTVPGGSPQSFEFSTSYGANFTLTDNGTNNSGSLTPGTYSVSENVPANWNLTSATCSDGSAPSAIGLDPGETVTCVFTNNAAPGTIIVEKQTDPNGAPGSFTFSGDAAGSISDGGQIVVGNLPPGAYTSQETVPAGWELIDIVCDDTNSTVSLADSRANFQLEPGETVTCTFYNRLPLDYGDAPDSYGTLLASNGARHAIMLGRNLGPVVDAEPDGQPSPLADDDDLNPPGAPDDEDGVTLSAFYMAGDPAATVIVDGGPSGGMLDAWIDFNGNGVFDHPAEHLWGSASQLLIPGSNTFTFSVPAGATLGPTYARFRLSIAGGLLPTGFAPNGEVEDYQVQIAVPGTIIIEKQTNPDGEPQTFEFTTDYGTNFFLSDGQTNNSGPLSPGTYSVTEINLTMGWVLTNITCSDGSDAIAIDLSAGETITCTFTNTIDPANIIILKFEDLNGSGTRDAGEPPLSGWDITLYTGSDCALANAVSSDVTDGTGNVIFSNLLAGDYSVAETLQAGWLNTTALCQNVTLAASATEFVNFGNQQPTTGDITAHKFEDLNGNGVLDAGEPDLSGWTLTLYSGSGCVPANAVSSDATDGSGNVGFSALTAGDYSVAETLQAGWLNTTALCQDVTLAAGGSESINFGNQQQTTGDITAHKFEDLNGNGVLDAGEPDLSGWTMTLHTGAGCDLANVVSSDATDSSGNTGFSSLPAGDYSVAETLQAGWLNTTALCQDVTLTAGGFESINFGNQQQPTSDIAAHKFEDLNGNGIQDAGEPGLSGWTMTLHTGAGCDPANVVSSDATDSSGNTGFSSLPAGDYSVAETLQAGWLNTTALCQDVTLAAGGSENINFGNQQQTTGDITAHKFEDLNGDGVLDAGEPDLNGWTMTLYSGSGCVPANVVSSDATDGSGNTGFSSLPAGDYSVAETLQAGWLNTTALCQDVTVTAGGSEIVDVGNQALSAGDIAARKFEDLNGNGVLDVGELGLSGWTMTLYSGSGCVPANEVSSNVTNAVGNVVFSSLTAGDYSIMETLQAGWLNTTALCQDITLAAGGPEIINVGNQQQTMGMIIVEKQTNPDGASDTFTFSGDAAGTIADGAQIVVGNLLPGTYTSQETVPTGWNLTSIVCDDSNSSGDVSTHTATFQLEAGETVTCVFNNTVEETVIDPIDSDADPQPIITDPALSKIGALASGQLGLPGEQITWTITATAPNNANLTNVVIIDTFRSELQIDGVTTTSGTVSVSGQTVTVTIPFMSAGSSVTIQVTTTVLQNPDAGIFENTAILVADDGVFVSATGTVIGVSSLPGTGYPPGN